MVEPICIPLCDKIELSMKIGIDFGTTRIVVAASDRGNFPIVNFETPEGEVRDWFPPAVAVQGNDAPLWMGGDREGRMTRRGAWCVR